MKFGALLLKHMIPANFVMMFKSLSGKQLHLFVVQINVCWPHIKYINYVDKLAYHSDMKALQITHRNYSIVDV